MDRIRDFYGLSAFGISLTIKASVGVSSFALNVTLATLSGIKVGITAAINLSFLAALLAIGSAADVPQTKGSEYLIMFLLWHSAI